MNPNASAHAMHSTPSSVESESESRHEERGREGSDSLQRLDAEGSKGLEDSGWLRIEWRRKCAADPGCLINRVPSRMGGHMGGPCGLLDTC